MRLTAVLAVVAAITTSPALALDCAGGRHIADAEVIPPASLGRVLRATQFAWDGGNRITHVCDLTTSSGDFESYWPVFSQEVNREFPGLCVMLTGSNGRDLYSCATAEAMARARGAARGSRAFRLHFDRWQSGLQATIPE